MLSFKEIEAELSPFVKELVQSETRFRFHHIGNDFFGDVQFFVITKEVIHCPTVLPSIEHEIAHAVEMKDKSRWTIPDWGLAVIPFNRNEDRLTPRQMFAGMAREIRVRAIELHMLSKGQQTNKESSKYNILKNEHAWGRWAKQMVPYGRFKNYQDVEVWVNDLRERTFNAWSKERIVHEWKIRLNHIQNWMETKEAS